MPDPVLADVDIANRALARIGESPVMSLVEDTELAGKVVAVYGDVVDAALAVYSWKWARRTRRLDALAAPPEALATDAGAFNGWPFAASFPLDALSSPLGLYQRWPDTTLRDFTVEGRTVYSRCPAVWGTFVMRIGPAEWPPAFRLAVVTWLAGSLAIPVTHDKNLADQLTADALGTPSERMQGGLMGRAIAMDVAQGGGTAVSIMQNDPLTSARYEGPWYGDAAW